MVRTSLENERERMIIGLNASPNHPIISIKPIKYFGNGVGMNKGVPQEGIAAMVKGLLEEKARGSGVSKSGVAEH